MHQVLFIENDIRYAKSLKAIAEKEDIELTHYTNFDEGFQELEGNPNFYVGAILDARCFVDVSSEERNIEKDSSVYYAIHRLQDYIKATRRHIPFCINTGFGGEFRENLEAMNIQVFDKASERDKMFNYMMIGINSMPITKLKTEFPDVYYCFEKGYLGDRAEQHLLTVFALLDNENYAGLVIEEILFNPVRKILEAIYKRLNVFDKEIIPDEAIVGIEKQVKFNWCKDRLVSGKHFNDKGEIKLEATTPFLPYHLHSVLELLHDITSTKSHDYEDYISRYLIKSVVYAALEMIVWFTNYIDNH
ncbi:hypothetical protein ACFLR8_01490 [Bacteroidota bacterium]